MLEQTKERSEQQLASVGVLFKLQSLLLQVMGILVFYIFEDFPPNIGEALVVLELVL